MLYIPLFSFRSRSLLLWVLVAAGSLAASGSVAPTASTAVPLRQHIVHVAYNEGDFDKVLEEIESFTRANKTYDRSDSIFIAKHLSVVYTANPDTREKGKYYMYRLLEMMPSAELVDMFVSDEIDRIFERVRREFLARQRAFGVDPGQIAMPGRPQRTDASPSASGPGAAAPGASTAPSPAASPGSAAASQPLPDPKPPVPFWKRTGVWVAGGAGLAAAGALATYVHLNEEEAEARRIRLRGESVQ